MPIIGKEKIRVSDKNDRSFYMEVEFSLNVNSDGYFTTTLKEEDVKIIQSYGINLYSNGRSNSRKGFFMNKTKEGLLIEIKEVLEKCMSKTLVEEKIILRYSFCTVASFGFTIDKKIVPNMGWGLDGKLDNDLYWQSGTLQASAQRPEAIGIQMYIKPFFKRKYKFLDNREKIEYKEFTPFGSNIANENQYYLLWLENICGTKPPEGGKIQEIDYTEERAKFFVEMYKSLCKLAYSIKHFVKPEEIIKLIENGKYLMPPEQ